MACRERLEQYLREASVAYEIQHHPAAYTARQVAASEHLAPQVVAKVVVAFADQQPVMLAIPASCQVDTMVVQAALGARFLRLAREDELQRLFPDCDTRAMPPFGNLYGLPVYVDSRLAERETLYFQVGTHTETMSLTYADFTRLVQPKVMSFAHQVTRLHVPFSIAGVVGR